jgi:adenylosuccinate synthase
VVLGAQWGDEGKGKVIDFLIDHRKVALPQIGPFRI